MAEEANRPSPRSSRRDSVRSYDGVPEFDGPQLGARDRKSLAGMSESVKAILAPLLGGKKSHSKVEVDLGRESGYSGAAAYEIVPTGSTPMQRYSTVEASTTPSIGATGAASPTGAGNVYGDTGTGADTTTPRPNNPRISDVFGPENRGRGPQEIKGKYEEKVEDEGPVRTGSPIDPAYARVDSFLPATKPKMKEYDEYIRDKAPQLRARVHSILADKSHEAGFERKLPAGEELPKLEDMRPIHGEPSEMPQPTGENPSILDRVKDTVTGQVPGHGIYSGKATIDNNNPEPDRLPTAVRGRLPVQDVGMGSNVLSGTGGGRFVRETVREPGKEGSGVPGRNPNEDHEVVLNEDMGAVDRLRDTVAAAKERKQSLEGNEAPSHAIVTEPEGGLPLHPRSAVPSANNPRGTMP